jgi:hypothetical protein
MRAEAPKKDLRGGRKPELARAELLDKAARARFETEIEGVLKRKPTSEARLSGALRAVAGYSPELRAGLARAAETLAKRGAYNRELYAAAIREVALGRDKRAPGILKPALATDEGGGSATLSAACFCEDPALAPLLSKLAASRHSLTAFSAETARVVRRESNGALLERLAPMIKEAHRISMCVDLFVPLAREGSAPVEIGRALGVLREAERHLGRWLVLAEVAKRAGDNTPLEEAKKKSQTGPESARSAWTLVAWALESLHDDRDGVHSSGAFANGAGGASAASGARPPPPDTRPTIELVARLSDRPSANRDMTFLFRLADAGAKSARPMMEAMTKAVPLIDENGVRAAMYLARDHGRDDLRAAIDGAARQTKKDELRGLAAAALYDLGMTDPAREIADELTTSRTIGNVAWAALIHRAAKAKDVRPLLTERAVRWIQWGWLE